MTVAHTERPPRLKFTAEDFYHMGEARLFEGRNVMLLGGEIIDMPDEGAGHFAAIHLGLEALKSAYGPAVFVRRPGPLEVALDTDPEPDIAVVRGSIRDYAKGHPTTAEPVIEFAETTLRFDRKFKLGLYAEARIPEYWIVNLVEQTLEVYKSPMESSGEWTYGAKATHVRGELILPPGAAKAIDPADLMV